MRVLFAMLVIGCAATEDREQEPLPTPSEQERVRNALTSFDAALTKGDWPRVSSTVTAASTRVLARLRATATAPQPQTIWTIDRLYGVALEETHAESEHRVDWGRAKVTIDNKTTTAHVTTDRGATVYLVKEKEQWKVDILRSIAGALP